MKKIVVFMAFFMMINVFAFSQKEATLTVKISSDSILLGNYFEVKFMVENAVSYTHLTLPTILLV